MSTGLTPDQRAAGEATLREWRSHQPDQVPCHYCGTLVWLLHAEPVPDNPADAYDRYACAACGSDGRGHRRTQERSTRRHRARQVRAAVVALAQEYREACRQHEAISRELWRTDVVATSTLLDEEQRTWDGMEQRRDALFAALEELEGLEGAQSRGGRRESGEDWSASGTPP